MFKIGKCNYFRYKLSFPTHRVEFNWKYFYSHNSTISKQALQGKTKTYISICLRKLTRNFCSSQRSNLVDRAKGTFSDLVWSRESISGNIQLTIREDSKILIIFSFGFCICRKKKKECWILKKIQSWTPKPLNLCIKTNIIKGTRKR